MRTRYKGHLSAFSALIASVGLFAAGPALAVPSQRTFVASYGSDVNPDCSRALPCRSFNAAIAQTNPGGEVVILDTAGYGPMTITKSLKVIGPAGVYGGISVVGGASPTTGIVINAGTGDEITLRGLDISGVPGVAPLPQIGIDVQSAAAVHIEKSSVGNFTQDTSACVNVNVATTTRVYVIDSFLRECRTGIYANGTAVVPNRPSVIVDNTRIERGRNSVSLISHGIWQKGFMDVSVRNSVISRQDFALQMDSLLGGSVSHLSVINSELTRNTTALSVTNTTNASPQVSIVGSQIVGSTDAVQVSNSAVGGNTWINFADSYVAYTGAGGMAFANSAADLQTRMGIEIVRSQVSHITNTAIDLSATNGCQVQLDVRDSTLSSATTLLKTSGSSSPLNVALTRSNLHQATTAIDHGQGTVQLDSTHVNYNVQDFINNGSGSIVSNGYNMVYNNINAPGPVYITPTVIPLK